MYFFRFLDIAALLKVSSCLFPPRGCDESPTRTMSPTTAVNPLRAAENPLSIHQHAMSCNRPLPAGMQRCCVGCDTARTKAGNVLWEHWDHRWVERPSLATVLRLRSRLQKRARVVPADMRDAGPSGVGSSATSQQASTSGRSAPKKRLGRIAQPSISAG